MRHQIITINNRGINMNEKEERWQDIPSVNEEAILKMVSDYRCKNGSELLLMKLRELIDIDDDIINISKELEEEWRAEEREDNDFLFKTMCDSTSPLDLFNMSPIL